MSSAILTLQTSILNTGNDIGGIFYVPADIYVTDKINQIVRKSPVNTTGGFTPLFTNQIGQISGIAINGSDKYVTISAHTIKKINSANSVSIFAGATNTPGTTNSVTGTYARFNNPTGIAIYSGYLYVSDTGNNSIRKINISTSEVTTLITGVSSPKGIAVNGNNIFVCTGNYVNIYNLNGTSITRVVGFIGPLGIAISADTAFVADTGNNRIMKFDLTSYILSQVVTTVTFNRPYAIGIDDTPNIYVADSSSIYKICNSNYYLDGLICKTTCSTTYATEFGRTCVSICPIGTYLVSGTNLCRPCALGTFKSTTGSAACTSCPINGQTTASIGSTAQSQCYCGLSGGSQTYLSGGLSCVVASSCPAATPFGNPDTKTCVTAANCPGNDVCTSMLCSGPYRPTYFGDPSTKTCVQTCPASYKFYDVTTKMCVNSLSCPVGYTTDINTIYSGDGTRCAQCNIGTYKSTADSSPCTKCATNQTTVNIGSTAQSQCYCTVINNVQLYWDASASPPACVAPVNCPGGKYGDLATKTCTACPVGKARANSSSSDATGSPGCTSCAVGYSTNNQTGQTSCTACALGTYQNLTGQATCIPCPINGQTTASTGSTAQSQCYCGLIGVSQTYLSGGLSCVVASSCPAATPFGNPDTKTCVTAANCPGTGVCASLQNCSTLPTYFGDPSTKTCVQPCPASTYGDPSTKTCVSLCPAGTYVDSANRICTPCPIGTSKSSSGTQTSCTSCSAGTYTNSTGQSACTDCGTGYYCSGGSSRSRCPGPNIQAGDTQITDNTQAKNINDCHCGTVNGVQYYWNGTSTCVPLTSCPAGTPYGNQTTKTCVAASGCPTGTFANSANKLCDSGCPVGTYGNSSTKSCTVCPIGTYSAAVGAGSCTPCDPGKTTSGTGSTDSTACTFQCVTGNYWNGTSCVSSATSCPRNTFGNSALRACVSASQCSLGQGGATYYGDQKTQTCVVSTSCPTGTKIDDGNKLCVLCLAGQTSTSVNSATCTNCSAGQYSSSGGACTSCATNYYSAAGSESCTACPINTDTGGGDASSCIACPLGKSSTSGSACTFRCSIAGQYWNAITSACVAASGCPTGYFGNTTTKTCDQCPTGTYLTNTSGASGASSSVACTNCSPPKTYSPAGSTSSSACVCPNSGFYSSATNSCVAGATSCPAGTYGNTDNYTCTACPLGKYRLANDSTNATGTSSTQGCTACPGGYSCSPTGITQCSAGTYATAGASSCTPCAAGTYSAAGVGSCTQCAAGTYSAAGSQNCTQCQAGTYSVAGASSCTQCAAGYYSAAGASSCTPCGGGKTTTVIPSSGTATASSVAVSSVASNAFDNDPNTTWSSPSNRYDFNTFLPISGSGEWLQITYTTPITIDSYTLYSNRALSWTVYGSNNNGTTFIRLDSRTETTVTGPAGRTFTLSSPSSSYTTFRIVFEKSDNTWVSVIQWTLNNKLATSSSDCFCPVISPYWDGTVCQAACNANYYPGGTDGKTCTQCPNNKVTMYSANDINGCVCPIGYYGSAGAAACTQCPGGKTTSGPGSADSSACYCPSSTPYWDGSNCVLRSQCPLGTYVNDNNKQCEVTCTLGLFGDPTTNPPSCVTSCPQNYYASGSMCNSCPNSRVSNYGSTSISACLCPVNTYGPNDGTACTLCPGNKITSVSSGATLITDCVCPGSTPYWNTTTSTCVASCPQNYYANGSTSTCTVCPNSRVSNPGSTNGSACVCPVNTYGSACVLSKFGAPQCYACTSCPGNKITSVSSGATLITDCVCPDRRPYWDTTTSTCVASCPESTYTDSMSCYSDITCPDGKYANQVTKTCDVSCPAGTYVSGKVCIQCSPGSFSTTTNAANCTSCSAGYYNSTAGATSCTTQCSAGSYSAAGASSCETCPGGKTTSGLGATNINACFCPVTTPYWDGTNCVIAANCPIDKPYGNQSTNMCVNAQTCTIGGDSLTRLCVTTVCSGTNTHVNPTTKVCEACPTGTTWDATNSVCKCTSGFWDGTQCVSTCPSGKYGNQTTRVCVTALECPGYGNPSTSLCVAQCPANTYGDTVIQVCTSCPYGTSPVGSTSVSACQCVANEYLSGGTCVTQCPAGTYGNTGVCASCPYGTSPVGSTSVSACQCAAGSYLSAGTCVTQCPADTYSDINVCAPCPYGNSPVGSTSVSECVCPADRYLNGQTCQTCPYGNSPAGSTSVSACQCPLGTLLFAGTACVSPTCPTRSIQTSNTTCSNCLAGSYISGMSCALCPVGTYYVGVSAKSSSDCISCPDGTYASIPGSPVCTPCPAGTFFSGTNGTSNTVCTACTIGTYSTSGSSQCTSCPGAMSTSSPGSTFCSRASGGIITNIHPYIVHTFTSSDSFTAFGTLTLVDRYYQDGTVIRSPPIPPLSLSQATYPITGLLPGDYTITRPPLTSFDANPQISDSTPSSGGNLPTNGVFARTSSNYIDYGSQYFDMEQGFSVSCKVTFSGTVGNSERIIDFGNAQTDNILLYRNGTTGTIVFSYRNGSTEYKVSSTNSVTQGNENVLMAVYQHDPPLLTLIINGTKTVATPAIAATTPRTLVNCYVGRSNLSTDAYFNGTIRNLRIYSGIVYDYKLVYKYLKTSCSGATPHWDPITEKCTTCTSTASGVCTRCTDLTYARTAPNTACDPGFTYSASMCTNTSNTCPDATWTLSASGTLCTRTEKSCPTGFSMMSQNYCLQTSNSFSSQLPTVTQRTISSTQTTITKPAFGSVCVQNCPADTYKDYDMCIQCPGTQLSSQGSTSISACQCPAGTYGVNGSGVCTPCGENKTSLQGTQTSSGCVLNCPAGSYVSGGVCAPCPYGTSPAGSIDISACQCPQNTFLSGGICVTCPVNTYGDLTSNTCAQCPGTQISPVGSIGIQSCQCPEGTGGISGSGICTACVGNQVSTITTNQCPDASWTLTGNVCSKVSDFNCIGINLEDILENGQRLEPTEITLGSPQAFTNQPNFTSTSFVISFDLYINTDSTVERIVFQNTQGESWPISDANKRKPALVVNTDKTITFIYSTYPNTPPNNYNFSVTSTFKYTFGVYFKCTCVVDGSQKTIAMYINGVKQAEQTTTSTLTLPTIKTFTWSSNGTAPGMKVKNVYWWNYILENDSLSVINGIQLKNQIYKIGNFCYTTQYSCPSETCTLSSYRCPLGYTLNGSVCVKNSDRSMIAATVSCKCPTGSYECPAGYPVYDSTTGYCRTNNALYYSCPSGGGSTTTNASGVTTVISPRVLEGTVCKQYTCSRSTPPGTYIDNNCIYYDSTYSCPTGTTSGVYYGNNPETFFLGLPGCNTTYSSIPAGYKVYPIKIESLSTLFPGYSVESISSLITFYTNFPQMFSNYRLLLSIFQTLLPNAPASSGQIFTDYMDGGFMIYNNYLYALVLIPDNSVNYNEVCFSPVNYCTSTQIAPNACEITYSAACNNMDIKTRSVYFTPYSISNRSRAIQRIETLPKTLYNSTAATPEYGRTAATPIYVTLPATSSTLTRSDAHVNTLQTISAITSGPSSRQCMCSGSLYFDFETAQCTASCPVATYGDALTKTCKPCPANTTSPAGSTNVSACVCAYSSPYWSGFLCMQQLNPTDVVAGTGFTTRFDNQWTIHEFTQNTVVQVLKNISNAQLLVVGGGAMGAVNGIPGGGGQVVSQTGVTGGSYSVTVGSGANGGPQFPGGSSSFGSVTASGGVTPTTYSINTKFTSIYVDNNTVLYCPVKLCSSDSDCTSSYCFNQICTPYCSIGTDCPVGYSCNSTTRKCIQCTSGNLCPSCTVNTVYSPGIVIVPGDLSHELRRTPYWNGSECVECTTNNHCASKMPNAMTTYGTNLICENYVCIDSNKSS